MPIRAANNNDKANSGDSSRVQPSRPDANFTKSHVEAIVNANGETNNIVAEEIHNREWLKEIKCFNNRTEGQLESISCKDLRVEKHRRL